MTARFQEDLRPAFVSVGGRNLFTCLSLPAGPPPKTLVVLCNSFGHEYEHAHRGLRQCAAALSSVGHAVVRFDYSSTGDSGDAAEAGPDLWEEDISGIASHFSALLGLSNVCIIGFRAAALLMSGVRKRVPYTVGFWHPVQDGSQFVAELEAANSACNESLGRAEATVGHSLLGWNFPARWRQAVSDRRTPGGDGAWCIRNSDEWALEGVARDITVAPMVFWRPTKADGIVPTQSISAIEEALREMAQ